MRKTIVGTEAYTPKKWTPLSIALTCFWLLSIAECFRTEMAVRIGAMLVVVVLTAILFIPLRNLALTLAGLAYLKVSREGISYRYGKDASTFAWSDIAGFRAVPINPKLSLVGITFSETAQLSETKKTAKAVARALTKGDFDGILLPDLYDWKPAELADYLNRQKERYGDPGAAARKIYEK